MTQGRQWLGWGDFLDEFLKLVQLECLTVSIDPFQSSTWDIPWELGVETWQPLLCKFKKKKKKKLSLWKKRRCLSMGGRITPKNVVVLRKMKIIPKGQVYEGNGKWMESNLPTEIEREQVHKRLAQELAYNT
ncbi:unnamed protein product [Camellia sinensis]